MPHAAAMLLPLYELVNVKGDEFEAAWTTRHDEHFQCSKDALARATYQAHPSATAETCINTDASDTAVGSVLQQRLNGVWTPISFSRGNFTQPRLNTPPLTRSYWRCT